MARGTLRPDGEAGSWVVAIPGLEGVPVGTSIDGIEVLHPGRDRYVEVVRALKASGFETCSDLCGVDYLTYDGRRLPEGVSAERFEVVVHLLSQAQHRRVRIRLQVPAADPVAPTLFFVYPGTENMEREAYDLFGVEFAGHPDLSRILLPDDWEGHPLRKDYAVGRVPVQFKEAPGPR